MAVNVAEEINIHVSDKLFWEKRHEYLEKRPWLHAALWVIGLGSPFLGLVLGQIPGLVIGFAISLLSLLLTPYAITKIREITRGGEQ